jgi:membrane protein
VRLGPLAGGVARSMAAEPTRRPTGPAPQPEHGEPRLDDPTISTLSGADYRAAVQRAAKETLADNVPMVASALAYSTFLALPSALLVLTGAFTLLASPDAIETVTERVGRVAPEETVTLLQDSLARLNESPGSSAVMVIVGFLVALWSTTGAMSTLMTGMNTVYGVEESRSFVRRRLLALGLVAVTVVAFVAVFGLLVLGPQLAGLVADRTGSWATWAWWLGQWPVLLVVLLGVFATLLYLAPDVDQPRWTFVSAGAVVAAAVWLAASGLFAVYTARFGSYNKAWGSFASVIVMLVWLWISGLALLFGAEVNAEIERSRELRQGKPAERELQVGTRT